MRGKRDGGSLPPTVALHSWKGTIAVAKRRNLCHQISVEVELIADDLSSNKSVWPANRSALIDNMHKRTIDKEVTFQNSAGKLEPTLLLLQLL